MANRRRVLSGELLEIEVMAEAYEGEPSIEARRLISTR